MEGRYMTPAATSAAAQMPNWGIREKKEKTKMKIAKGAFSCKLRRGIGNLLLARLKESDFSLKDQAKIAILCRSALDAIK